MVVRPLDGLRVIAVEQAVAAPLCTRHLAEMGADVVKVERTVVGDFARRYDGYVMGESSHFVWLNRGKRSLALDISVPAGRGIMLDLLKTADVLVSNLAPGAIERVIDPDDLAALNPRLVHCLINGYGSSGPYRERRAFDALVQGEAGVTVSTGTADEPAKPGVSLADLAAGSYALSAILAALLARTTSGRGSRFEVTMFDAVTEWMSPLLLAAKYGGGAPPPAGTHHASIVPYGAFDAADGVQVNIAVQNERQWQVLCTEVIGRPDLLEEPRFASNAGRLEYRDEVVAAVAKGVVEYPSAVLAERLELAGLPWGLLNTPEAVINHPQLVERGRWQDVTLPAGDTAQVLASPLADLLQNHGGERVPGLGENTREVLDELGYPAERADELAAAGIVYLGGRDD
jgi:itaconate CoA-transferase